MALSEVDALLNDKKKLLTEIYFDLQKHYEAKYGENTVVLMEVGTFFEVYEVDNEALKLGKAKEIAEVLNIQLTRKSNHPRKLRQKPQHGGRSRRGAGTLSGAHRGGG